MKDKELQPEKHVCSLCKGEFKTVEEYIDHICPETGYTPADPEHQGEDFKAVQEAALRRGADAQAEQE